MTKEQIDTVLDNRLREIETFLDSLQSMDMSDPEDWPPGTQFVAGFGRMMATACRNYIEENRGMLTDEASAKDLTAASG